MTILAPGERQVTILALGAVSLVAMVFVAVGIVKMVRHKDSPEKATVWLAIGCGLATIVNGLFAMGVHK